MLRKRFYRISIFFGFSSGQAKSIRIRYVKKNLTSQKYSDTCGRGLNLLLFDVLIGHWVLIKTSTHNQRIQYGWLVVWFSFWLLYLFWDVVVSLLIDRNRKRPPTKIFIDRLKQTIACTRASLPCNKTGFLSSIKLNKVKKASIYKTTLEELRGMRGSV